MKIRIAFLLSLLLAFGQAYADEKNADAHKSAKAKSAAKKGDKKAEKKGQNKSEKNSAQKAESSLTDWADKNNIWKRSSK
jgi:hypothetical protein